MACVTICANSMAAKAGDSQPLLLNTSTQAWISRSAWKHKHKDIINNETINFCGDVTTYPYITFGIIHT